MRRIVTGTTPAGLDIIVDDTDVDVTRVPGYGGYERAVIWADDQSSRLPNDGESPPATRFFPPTSGYRVIRLTLPPDAWRDEAISASELAERVEAAMPGAVSDGRLDPESQLHFTDSVDVGLVLEGEVILDLGGGRTTALSAGDYFVQNGTRHAWRNLTPRPVTMLVVLIGADRVLPTDGARGPGHLHS
jgi:quercetin dioxygenase-like cupin family protein